MKALALITYTDCENKWRSIEAAGHEVRVETYDDRPHDRHRELCDVARDYGPDFIMLVGAVEHCHGRPCPQNDVLLELQSIAPSVLMCNDAADPPWWGTLENYMQNNCFSLIVSIDGRLDTPLMGYRRAMHRLTPIDHRPFKPKPWHEKATRCGMIGGNGGGDRGDIINALSSSGLLNYHHGSSGPGGRAYDDFATIMCDFKSAFVHPATGSGQSTHVKGRVVEAGFAGACVFDRFDSPTKEWFVPGHEFLQYENREHLECLLRDIDDNKLHEIAERFHQKVVTNHHPRVFWSEVIQRLQWQRSRGI